MTFRRWIRRAALTGFLLLVIAAATLWGVAQHIPEWYQPQWLTRSEAEVVRREMEHTFEVVTHKLAAGEPFSITLTEQQINRMLCAQRLIWPSATPWLSDRWTAPCVCLEPGHLRLAMRYRRGEVRSVISILLAARMQGNGLNIEVLDLNAGSLALPGSVAARLIPADSPGPGGATPILPTRFHHLLTRKETLHLPNPFDWPNGNIPFRITGLDLQADRMTLQVVPGGW